MEELIMSSEVYEAAMKGDVSVFNNNGHNFQSHTFEGKNNILHVAIQNDKNGQNLGFIQQVATRFPSLLGKTNSRGDTVLHISAKCGNTQITQQLVMSLNEVVNNGGGGEPPLWRARNSEGDTCLHTALKRSKVEVALLLINLDDNLASVVNQSGETPLHLAVRICTGFGASRNPQPDVLHAVIDLLLIKASVTASMRDADDLTPLLRVACRPNRLPVIQVILGRNPQLAEQRDLHGRTILHLIKLQTYEEYRRALDIPGIVALKDEQDSDGNTPLHLAIEDSDFIKVQILMEVSADFTINNSHGMSPWDLIQLQEGFTTKMEEEMDKAMNGLMTKQLYIASVEGDMDFLSQHDDINLLSRSMEGNNILHIALGPESVDKREFVRAVLDRFPILLCQTNNHGENPLHVAVRRRTLSAFELLRSCKDTFHKIVQSNALRLHCPPWRARNLEGNTPLHEALRAGNAISARFLIQLDDEVARYVNNSNETPLHICTRYKQVSAPLSVAESIWPDYMALTRVRELVLLLRANVSATCSRDVDGLTPLLRAAQCNQLEIVGKILSWCPGSAEVRDFDGRTVLHHITLSNKHEKKRMLQIPAVKALASVQDYGGNTPLHLAIKKGHFYKVKVLVKISSAEDLLMTNNDGDLPFDLIRSQTEVPHKATSQVLSLYGVSEAAMRENLNILLVIAVLLATITFAAAFTVPGGLDNQTGVPTLVRKAAFKVFMISDTYALCCSMLALFSLIWAMASETWVSVKLIDLSVFVLQQSFYATTLAFMTGVYVAISSKAFSTAIVVCALCSGLMVCSLKPINLYLSRILPFVTNWLKEVATSCGACCSLCLECLLCTLGS